MTDWTYSLAKGLLKPWLTVWFQWTIDGLEHIPRSGPAVLAVNHISYFDPLAAAFVVDKAGRRARFLAKSELFADRRLGWVLRGANQIEVKRGTKDAPVALDQAYEALEAGELLVIFPEGTVTTNADLQPMAAKSGAARLAVKTGVPLIPCALWGTANVWPKGYKKRWNPRQRIVARIGPPVQASIGMDSPDEWRILGTKLIEDISLLLAGIRPQVPDRRPVKRSAA
ncbi:MAG: 1-acyl-sn-glycerol-3-phosphate acyltransferase [Actinomycetota bacterium]|nr:1-acyl-sn-glycerol-3-phosphate acyltransferase [Actinomycetota bacterium]